ncbi:hypothetical protein ACFWFX_18685 [Streptomyces roseolus]|uniref:hypothetical protein n=1 Tax=Streptomyces roseolus TaxID=67358 RepID=UPI00364C1A58
MNARDKISTALQASVFSTEHAEELAQELYDDVARELAERQRGAVDRMQRRDPVCAWRLVDGLVDLIDPEVP